MARKTLTCTTIHFLRGIGMTIAVLAGWLIYSQLQIQSAIVQWDRVGGGINVLFNSKYGPDEMFLGSMPGVPTSSDLTEIRNAAIRLNTTGGCRKLHLSNVHLSCEQLIWLLSGLELDQLSLSDMIINEECVEYLANRKDIKMMRIGRCLSADAIRTILRSSPERCMDLARKPLSPEEINILLKEFKNRLKVYPKDAVANSSQIH